MFPTYALLDRHYPYHIPKFPYIPPHVCPAGIAPGIPSPYTRSPFEVPCLPFGRGSLSLFLFSKKKIFLEKKNRRTSERD
jgi:hypothetical protein